MNTIEPSVILLPIVLMGKITHEEANTIRSGIIRQQIPEKTEDILKQFESVLGRKIE